MNRVMSRKGSKSHRRPLQLESLERREVFSVGGLDPTFGNGWGKTVTDFGGGEDWIADSAFQSNGKIVVVGGTVFGGGGQNFAVARYNSDGSLDASFGGFGVVGAGRVVTDFAAGDDQAQKVLIQADGKILVIGFTNPFGIEYGESQYDPQQPVQEHRWAIARYNADGSADNSFGVLGKVVLHRPGVNDNLNPAGAFIVGNQLVLVSEDMLNSVLTRVNLSDGSLDLTFGNGGFVETASPIVTRAAALHNDGIVVAGRLANGSSMALSRIHMDGSLDTNFGNNGVAIIGPEYGGQIFGIVVQADGCIVGAGEGVVVRVLPNGLPDGSFSVDGVVSWTHLPRYHEFRDVALGPNGTIVAAGYANQGTDFAVVRIGANGVPDANFGVDGMVTVDFGLFGYSDDRATSVLTYSNGKILVSGYANYDFALARLNGTSTVNIPGGSKRLNGLATPLVEPAPIRSLLEREALLSLVERIDRAIAEQKETNLALLLADPVIARETPATAALSRTPSSAAQDDFFAELGDQPKTHCGVARG